MPLTFHDSTEQLTSGIDSYLKYQNSLQSWNFCWRLFNWYKVFDETQIQIPNDWLYTEQLENNISMVQALVAKKVYSLTKILKLLLLKSRQKL